MTTILTKEEEMVYGEISSLFRNQLDKEKRIKRMVEIIATIKHTAIKETKAIYENCPQCTGLRDEALQEYKRFVLNVLDGVDIADERMGNKGGGTKAIRLALKSRII